MTTALDTNILIDLLLRDTPHAQETARRVEELKRLGPLIVSEAAYSEFAPLFRTREAVDIFLADMVVRVRPSSFVALHRAGRAWRAYTTRRPRGPVCARCGATRQVFCENCGAELQYRQHTIGDFLIGGHAVTHADRLLTRDRRSYPRYFPELALA